MLKTLRCPLPALPFFTHAERSTSLSPVLPVHTGHGYRRTFVRAGIAVRRFQWVQPLWTLALMSFQISWRLLPTDDRSCTVDAFSVPTSGSQLVQQRLWYVLSCLWESAYKRPLAVYRKE